MSAPTSDGWQCFLRGPALLVALGLCACQGRRAATEEEGARTAPPAPFEGEIDVKGSMPMELLLKVKGKRVRIETAGGGDVLILDAAGAAGVKELTLSASRREVVEDTFPPAAPSHRAVTQTGAVETIAGHACKVIRVTDPGGAYTEACVSRDPDLAGGVGPFAEVGGLTYERELSDGLALRIAHFEASGERKDWMQVSRVTAKAIADSELEVPAGYTKVPKITPVAPVASGTPSGAGAPGALRGAPVRIGVGGGRAEVPDTQVVVRFENTGDEACVLHGYELRWAGGRSSLAPVGGSARCRVDDVAVPSRASIETTCTLPSRTQLGATPGMSLENTSVSDVDATCKPAGAPEKPAPALPRAAVCDEDRPALAKVLHGYARDPEDRSRGSVEVDELEAAVPPADAPLSAAAGPAYWGPLDLDGDGKPDRVLRYTGIDFWSTLFFVARGPCYRFAGFVEGYQVQWTTLPGGKRGVRVLPYPTGPASNLETRLWTGTALVKRP